MINGIRVRTGNESGQVSILTVVVFILLFSVLVISFSRIMVTASRQAVNDELAASAKAAAESGVEDAKRVLNYCATSDAEGCPDLKLPLEKSTCTTVSSVYEKMGLQRKVASGSSVRVGDSTNQEEYLCLKMTTVTPDYLGSLVANGNADNQSESVVIPLKFVNKDDTGTPVPPKSVRVQWHNTSPDSDGSATLLTGSDLPKASEWSGTTPAVLRVEFVAVPKTSISVGALTANTRAVTLRPSKDPTDETNVIKESSTGFYSLNSWKIDNTIDVQPNGVNPKVFIMKTNCKEGNSGDGYACGVSFTIPQNPANNNLPYLFDTGNFDYYLRLQAIYRNTHFRISAKATNGTDLYFNQVQANVDVTGRASDSLTRLSVRLDPDNGNGDYQWWPDSAVDTAGKVCKNMTIEAYSGADNCNDK